MMPLAVVYLLLEVARGVVRAELPIGERHLIPLGNLVRPHDGGDSEVLPRFDNPVAVTAGANDLVGLADGRYDILLVHAQVE